MRKLWQRYRNWLERQRAETRIIVVDRIISVAGPKGAPIIIPIPHILRVVLYKRDELTTDLVCCEITARSGDGARFTALVHEEMDGFVPLMSELESLDGFDRNWFEKVTNPAFAENRIVVFEREAVPNK